MSESEVPDFLKVLCILSIIGGVFGIIGAIGSMFVSNPDVVSVIADVFERSGQEMPEAYYTGLENAGSIGVITAIFAIISLVGAIFMLKLKKIGFYMYALANIALIFVQPLFNGFDILTVGGLIFTIAWNAIWIVSYGIHLKYME